MGARQWCGRVKLRLKKQPKEKGFEIWNLSANFSFLLGLLDKDTVVF